MALARHHTNTTPPAFSLSPAPRYLSSATTTALTAPPCRQSPLAPRIPPPRESHTGPTPESGISLTSSISCRPSFPSHTSSTHIAIFCKDGKHTSHEPFTTLVVIKLSKYSHDLYRPQLSFLVSPCPVVGLILYRSSFSAQGVTEASLKYPPNLSLYRPILTYGDRHSPSKHSHPPTPKVEKKILNPSVQSCASSRSTSIQLDEGISLCSASALHGERWESVSLKTQWRSRCLSLPRYRRS